MVGEVFGIGSPLKDVLPSDLQAVRMALGFISLPPFFFELLTNPCVLRRYLKEKSIKKYTVQEKYLPAGAEKFRARSGPQGAGVAKTWGSLAA